MFRHVARLVVRFRAFFVIAFLLGAAGAASFVPQLRFDFTPQQLFRSSSDALEYREVFAERFGREDNVAFVLVESPDVFRPADLRFMRELTRRVAGFDEVEAAVSLPTMELPRADEPGVISTEPIVAADGEVSLAQAEALRSLAMNEPLVKGEVVSADGRLATVLIWLRPQLQDVQDLEAAVRRIEGAAEELAPPEGLSWRIGGVPHLRAEIVDSLQQQQLIFIPATGLVYMLILLLLFRRFSGVALPLATVTVAAVFTVMLLVLTDSSINIVNNVLPSLIFIIGVSDSIHMLVRDAEETEAGAKRLPSIRAMVRHTGAACLLTSATTAVGFFSLLAADTQILQDFGWQAGLGVFFAYGVTLFFLPAALSFLRPVRRRSAAAERKPAVERWLDRLGEHVLAHPAAYVAFSLAVTALFAYFGSTVRIDTVLLEVYEPGHPVYRTTKQLEEALSGVLPVEVSLEADEVDAFKDPEIFRRMDALQDFAEEQSIVLSSRSLVDFHQATRVALLGDPAEREVMPQSRAQVEQIHLLIAGSPDSRAGVDRFVSPDFTHARVLVRVEDAGAVAQLALAERLEAKLAELFPPELGVRYRLTGDAYVASMALDSFIRDLFSSLMVAMLIIFAMMTAVFRSLKVGLISVLPNVIPLVLTFGYMGVMGINLNTTTIIIFAISLGLAVDDTIHFLARFREEQNAGKSPREAVLGAYAGAGRAILLTSIMLVAGLAVLLLSDFVPTQQFAMLTGITIVGAILGDLLLLPPLLFFAYGGDR